jgi:hypothetical protein
MRSRCGDVDAGIMRYMRRALPHALCGVLASCIYPHTHTRGAEEQKNKRGYLPTYFF